MVQRIRREFLNVLHGAVTGGEKVNLDFVYGDVENGTLRPLDGQQRLTTLFLLHWYLAFRAERINEGNGWKRFSYAIRASARLFCKRLVECQPPVTVEKLSAWIENQSWYLYTWSYDPTVQSMLVMVDAMHEKFLLEDCLAAWERLVDVEKPAISFHLLPMKQMGLSEDLYIKMNSRGKPLTVFENFKARFEQSLDSSCPERVEEFALKVDGAWSDLLWPYRGSDFTVDDEFLMYFQFVTEVCEWREGRIGEGDIMSLAEQVYGKNNPNAAAHLDFLFRAFDNWVGVNIPEVFSGLFAATPAPLDLDHTSKITLFGQQSDVDVDLFSACCKNYGQTRGRNREFSWPHTILLYAVLLRQIDQARESADHLRFSDRLRIVRNLVEASSNELRLDKMPALLADVQLVILDGTLEGISAFNQAQIADERLKAELLTRSPGLKQTLFHLEDHPILRGCLAAFELDDTVFERRAGAFHRLFADPACLSSLTGALLATGDYSRKKNDRVSQLGSGSNLGPWRDLLTGAGRLHLGKTRDVLGRLLDEVAANGASLQSTLDRLQNNWLNARVNGDGLGWRWYFVKYPVMREGNSGIYVGSNGFLDYNICMLNKIQMNSWYRDPFLLAIYRESGAEEDVEDPWFTGYETEPRWLRLKISGTRLRCAREGLLLHPPLAPTQAEAFSQVCADHGIGTDNVLLVPQVEQDGCKLDACDRVQLGATLLRDFVKAGL
jgi:hypothetical protein